MMLDPAGDFSLTFWTWIVSMHAAVLVAVSLIDFFKRVAR